MIPLCALNIRNETTYYEPQITASILADLPTCLRAILSEVAAGRSILVSSNSLSNRFIFDKWGIRPSQRRRYRHLFSTVRRQSRQMFDYYLLRGRVEWDVGSEHLIFRVYRFDDIRGNLILEFVRVSNEAAWTLTDR